MPINDDDFENLSLDEINELFKEIVEIPMDNIYIAGCHDPVNDIYK